MAERIEKKKRKGEVKEGRNRILSATSLILYGSGQPSESAQLEQIGPPMRWALTATADRSEHSRAAVAV